MKVIDQHTSCTRQVAAIVNMQILFFCLGTAGLAYVGTACGSYRFSKTSKTGIAEDHGAFDGLKTVSHEMGHM